MSMDFAWRSSVAIQGHSIRGVGSLLVSLIVASMSVKAHIITIYDPTVWSKRIKVQDTFTLCTVVYIEHLLLQLGLTNYAKHL